MPSETIARQPPPQCYVERVCCWRLGQGLSYRHGRPSGGSADKKHVAIVLVGYHKTSEFGYILHSVLKSIGPCSRGIACHYGFVNEPGFGMDTQDPDDGA